MPQNLNNSGILGVPKLYAVKIYEFNLTEDEDVERLKEALQEVRYLRKLISLGCPNIVKCTEVFFESPKMPSS